MTIACLDVHYADPRAAAACVVLSSWQASEAEECVVRTIDQVMPYEPGAFYRRELPCLEELERTINHPTFAFPTSVARYKNRLLVVSSQFDTAGSPAAVSGTQLPVVPFWVTEIREKIVTTIPLDSIWTDEEQVDASRERYLTPSELTEMLELYPVEFMVAERGAPLKRIPVDKCYEFWESEVRRHLLSPRSKVDRSKLPDEYGYIASEWLRRIEVPIVLLEKIH